MYPSLRSLSIPLSASWALPLLSACLVQRNSSTMAATVLADDAMVPVQGAQPRLR
jgi:hypothetical protein